MVLVWLLTLPNYALFQPRANGVSFHDAEDDPGGRCQQLEMAEKLIPPTSLISETAGAPWRPRTALSNDLNRDQFPDTRITMSTQRELTPRQQQVMALIGQGMTTREVAEALGLSCHYVRNLRYVIRWRLGLNAQDKLSGTRSQSEVGNA
jgi:DNA-binding CsgD family transcriptional regulator